MPTLNIRDVPEETVAAIDASAAAANARSRETYLRTLLNQQFGPGESVVAATAARAREIMDLAESLGKFGVLCPAPTIPTVARAIGHPDPSVLESELRGGRPLSFSDGDRFCTLFGIDRTWLESGGESTPRFATRAKYNDCQVMLYDFLDNGIPYEELFFILTDAERSVAAIVGHTPSDEPAVGWRYDVLIDEIPIHDQVGGTGRAHRRKFADLVTALYFDAGELFSTTPWLLGRMLPYPQYVAMVSGYVHPATATSTYAPGLAQPVSRASDWFADFPSFEKPEAYTRGYREGHAALLTHLRRDGITSTEQYETAMREKIRSWRSRLAARKQSAAPDG